MELLLSDEQKLLHDSAATLIERHAGAGRVRARREAPSAIDRQSWAAVAERCASVEVAMDSRC